MSVVRALRHLLLGETWTLPLGVACLLLAAALLRRIAPGAWHDAGGFFLLGGAIGVLLLAVALGARPRRPSR